MLSSDDTLNNRLVWVCFLIQEGANTEVKNLKGKSVLQMCSQQVADVIMQFKGKGYDVSSNAILHLSDLHFT